MGGPHEDGGTEAGGASIIQNGNPLGGRPGNDRLPPLLALLLKTAQREIDRHVNNHGLCAACGGTYPCDRAALADLALSAM
jgi:hypothetical protein